MSNIPAAARPPGSWREPRPQQVVFATLSDRLFLVCATMCALVAGVMLIDAAGKANAEFLTHLLQAFLGLPFSLGGGVAWLISRLRKPSDPLSPRLRWAGAAMLALPWAVWSLSELHVFS